MPGSDEVAVRLTMLEVRCAEIADALAESMLIQAQFMTWVARNAQFEAPKQAIQAVDFSQRLIDELTRLGDANRAFVQSLKESLTQQLDAGDLQ